MKTTIKTAAVVACAAASSAAFGQLSIVSNISGTFVDIAAPANLVAGSQNDDASAPITIPAGFGNAVLASGTASACTNGRMTATVDNTFTNTSMSASSLAGYYPYFDDLHTGRTTTGSPASGIYAAQVGDAFVVQWVGELFNNNGSMFTFQVQIFNAAGQAAHGGALGQYIYANPTWANGSAVMTGAGATIGVSGSPTDFAQWSFNTASVVAGQTVLSIVPTPGATAALSLGGLAAFRRRRA